MHGGNVIFVVAYKDEGGIYLASDYTYTDVVEAIQVASDYLLEDSACDPKVIQVVLDPASPHVVEMALLARLGDEARKVSCTPERRAALEAAAKVIGDRLSPDVHDLNLIETAEDLLTAIEEAEAEGSALREDD